MMLRRLLCGGSGGVALGELALEALDASGCIHQLLLPGEEGVAGRADFQQDIAFVRGAGFEGVAAGALDVGGGVAGMNSLLRHGVDLDSVK